MFDVWLDMDRKRWINAQTDFDRLRHIVMDRMYWMIDSMALTLVPDEIWDEGWERARIRCRLLWSNADVQTYVKSRGQLRLQS